MSVQDIILGLFNIFDHTEMECNCFFEPTDKRGLLCSYYVRFTY